MTGGINSSQLYIKNNILIDLGDYSDFFSCIHNAVNNGLMFKSKEDPILPNWYVCVCACVYVHARTCVCR